MYAKVSVVSDILCAIGPNQVALLHRAIVKQNQNKISFKYNVTIWLDPCLRVKLSVNRNAGLLRENRVMDLKYHYLRVRDLSPQTSLNLHNIIKFPSFYNLAPVLIGYLPLACRLAQLN